MTLRLRHLAGAAALVAALLAWAQPARELGFTTMASAGLLDAYGARFGTGARTRLEGWKQFAVERKAAPAAELELLSVVNAWMNRIRFIEDVRHWRREDYWATPAESVASNGGDCEDYSIAKYFLLKELGVPIARLRLTYVNAVRLGQAHMVLAYYPSPDAEPLVLDNLDPAVRLASQRTDLVPVYSFNDEEVWIEARGRSGSPRQIRNWSAVIERLEHEARM
ncbi:MAG: transglutaminase-like cysteine peptidase [Burkholderiales bacterium]